MLKPSMQELMKRVGNRYLLVNLAAQRARDIADIAEEKDEPLNDKAVKLALDEIAAGTVVYRPGPRTEVIIPQNKPVAAAIVDVDDALVMDDEDFDEDAIRDEDDEDADDEDDARSLSGEYHGVEDDFGDGDVPPEDR